MNCTKSISALHTVQSVSEFAVTEKFFRCEILQNISIVEHDHCNTILIHEWTVCMPGCMSIYPEGEESLWWLCHSSHYDVQLLCPVLHLDGLNEALHGQAWLCIMLMYSHTQEKKKKHFDATYSTVSILSYTKLYLSIRLYRVLYQYVHVYSPSVLHVGSCSTHAAVPAVL